MDDIKRLKVHYPWIQTPLIVSAPMRLIALADMAVEVSKAGGLGFIGSGTNQTNLASDLQSAQSLLRDSDIHSSTLPIGIGFINWGAHLSTTIPLIQQYKPCAVWFFAPSTPASLQAWTEQTRHASPDTKIWIQIGSVAEAKDALAVHPDVLVIQGTDAGGHGLAQGAGITSLVPEVIDTVRTMCPNAKPGSLAQAPIFLAAGGIAESRGAAAALCLGVSGVVMGTRFLASNEANITRGYRDEIIRAADGGQTTVRTKVYDILRGTTGWAESHNARGVVNRSFVDAQGGLSETDNKRLYKVEEGKGDVGWGVEGRMTTYAGSVVGLVKEVRASADIVIEVREGAREVLRSLAEHVDKSRW
ncbi:oxidoreductase [Lophiostoma macrostomum CBS 122681]|uniref:Oxidoreductase n=1 Tax=Lophiostoma macrostomum CBS 122681 TaxID=1314788 RepID=A0A6A6SSQ4_9PLEO|nr:oxidoreductase [Lophiostoma macrostomum CBS 122681]